MYVPTCKNSVGRVRQLIIETAKEAIDNGIDPEWLERENLTGRIQVHPETVLLEYHDRLIGEIVSHKQYKSGSQIRTTPIEMIIYTRGEFRPMTIAFTRNSRYEVLNK